MAEAQATVDEFIDNGDSDKQATTIDYESDDIEETTILFRLSDDPFVNEAAAEIGRRLANEGLVDITPTRIQVAEEAEIDDVVRWIERLFEQALENTHCRTTVAHQINGIVREHGDGTDDDRWIHSPTTYFPDEDDDLTIYPDDEVTVEALENNGLPTENVDYLSDDAQSVYKLSPTYVGHPAGFKFEYQINRHQRYLDTFVQTLTGEFDADDPACMLCGSKTMPTTKGVENKNLEFNQSFDIMSTASGVSVPLGMGSRDTAHSGRCAACLIAGFYYTLMPKVVRYKDHELCGGSFEIPVSRIFTPRGDFEHLVEVRGDFDRELLTWIDEPTTNDRARRETLSARSTPSRGLQNLQFYEAVLQHVNKEKTHDHYNFAVEHRPTALISYTSAHRKSGNPIRDIREVESIDPEEWAYGAVRQRTIDRSEADETYWPVDDVLNWYINLDEDSIAVETLDDIGYGVLGLNLQRLERGHFEIAKSLEQEQGSNAPYVLPIGRTSHYFTTIMQQATADTTDRIDDEAIESIKRVASNVGKTFYERDDISVLIALQNASTADEFLSAFEKASMQAQKKASDEDGGTNSWSGQNDIARVLKLINDSETFEPAKRMFVIHASLAAQYMNAQQASDEDGGD